MKFTAYAKNSWLLIPAIVYIANVMQNATNIPIMDDYWAILDFLHQFKEATPGHKLALLFMQHNEHRILASRLVYVLYYYVAGGINFRALLLIATLQMLPIGLVGLYLIRNYLCIYRYWQVAGIMWMLLVFDLNTYESGSIAMYGMQNWGVIMLFFLAMYFYIKNNLWAAGICHFLMIFSGGNGMIGSVVLFIYCIPYKDRSTWVSGLLTLLLTPLYFIHYHGVEQHNVIDIGNINTYFISVWGCPFSIVNCRTCGTVLMLIFLCVFPYRKIMLMWPLLCILAFVIGSVATASIFRAGIAGAQPQASRYLIYPEILIGITIVFLYMKLNKYRLQIMIGVLAVMLMIYRSNFTFGQAGFARYAARAQYIPYWHTDTAQARRIADTACMENIYCIQENQ